MPGYRSGFSDATILFLNAADWFRHDLTLLVQYIEAVQDKVECYRCDDIQEELGFTFAEFEQAVDEKMCQEPPKETTTQ